MSSNQTDIFCTASSVENLLANMLSFACLAAQIRLHLLPWLYDSNQDRIVCQRYSEMYGDGRMAAKDATGAHAFTTDHDHHWRPAMHDVWLNI